MLRAITFPDAVFDSGKACAVYFGRNHRTAYALTVFQNGVGQAVFLVIVELFDRDVIQTKERIKFADRSEAVSLSQGDNITYLSGQIPVFVLNRFGSLYPAFVCVLQSSFQIIFDFQFPTDLHCPVPLKAV